MGVPISPPNPQAMKVMLSWPPSVDKSEARLATMGVGKLENGPVKKPNGTQKATTPPVLLDYHQREAKGRGAKGDGDVHVQQPRAVGEEVREDAAEDPARVDDGQEEEARDVA
jgi:hypothetical protein